MIKKCCCCIDLRLGVIGVGYAGVVSCCLLFFLFNLIIIRNYKRHFPFQWCVCPFLHWPKEGKCPILLATTSVTCFRCTASPTSYCCLPNSPPTFCSSWAYKHKYINIINYIFLIFIYIVLFVVWTEKLGTTTIVADRQSDNDFFYAAGTIFLFVVFTHR